MSMDFLQVLKIVKISLKIISKLEQNFLTNFALENSFVPQTFAVKGFPFKLRKTRGSRGNEKYNNAHNFQKSFL